MLAVEGATIVLGARRAERIHIDATASLAHVVDTILAHANLMSPFDQPAMHARVAPNAAIGDAA